jgi:hypothetical protein
MRDASTALRLGHLMYRGRFMRTGKDRVEVDMPVPIAVGDVHVRRGDIVTGGGGDDEAIAPRSGPGPRSRTPAPGTATTRCSARVHERKPITPNGPW